jgi:nucleoside-diphosphate-sugar epimerase
MAAAALRALIVGGGGFIGSHLSRHCLDQGDEVHVLARDGSDISRLDAVRGRLTIHRLALDDRGALEKCLRDVRPDWICHLAVRTRTAARPDLHDLPQSIDDNLRPLLNLAMAIAATDHPPKALVRVGSLAEYGGGAAVPHDEREREDPLDSYTASLVAGTHYLQMVSSRLPCRVTTARPALVYGPTQSDSFFIPALIRSCLGGRVTIVRRPEARRDIVHVQDVARALRLLAMAPAAPAILNIATGMGPTIGEIAEKIRLLTNAPEDLVRYEGEGGAESSDIMVGSPALAAAAIGWRAEIGLDEGLAKLVSSERLDPYP